LKIKAVLTGNWIAYQIALEEERLMPIAKITGQGLAAIALSVALLWSCLIGERVMVRRASIERTLVMRDLERMQRTHLQPNPLQLNHRSEPVSAPVHIPRRVHVTTG
jgi:hypothetical protein